MGSKKKWMKKVTACYDYKAKMAFGVLGPRVVYSPETETSISSKPTGTKPKFYAPNCFKHSLNKQTFQPFRARLLYITCENCV